MPKRILQGVVVSDKQEKTLVVKVERRFTHPLLKKTVRKSKNYHAHVENKTQKVGDNVSIEETKPISKLKRWIVIDRGGSRRLADVAARRETHPEATSLRQTQSGAAGRRRPSGKKGV